MKRLAVGTLALLPLLAFAAPKDGFYVGATLDPINTTDMAVTGFGSDSYDNDFGFSLIVGYDHLLNQNLSLGLSVEYNNLGDSSYSDSMYVGMPGLPVISYKENISVSGFSATIRPKFYFTNLPIYISPYVGLGRYEFEVEVSTNISPTEKDSINETFIKYGIEVGAQFDNNLMVSAGWKESFYDDNGIEIDIHGLYAGIGYRF